MKNKSIWEDVIKGTTYPELKEDISVDVLIIGGGITGVNTGYQLLNSGLKVALLEKNLIGSGVSSRTTGKLTYLQENMASKIALFYGKKKAREYIDSQKEAIVLARNIIHKEKIDCNLEKVRSYIFANSETKKLEKEKKLLKKLGIKVKSSKMLLNGERVKKSYYVDDTYVFHPVKYIRSLAKICADRGTLIYENTKVLKISYDKGYTCVTPYGKVFCKYLVFAGHYPYFLKPLWLIFKAYIEKSYIKAVEGKNYKFSAITVGGDVRSIRYFRDGEDSFKIELAKSHNFAIKNNEKANFKDLLQEGDKGYLWSNKDIMTIDALPYIGKIDKKNFYIGTGYNTWGMTNGVLAGKILSDIILEKNNKYIKLFSPKRFSLLASFREGIILGSSAYSFMKTRLSKNKRWYSSRVCFKKMGGREVGIYTDTKGEKHIVYNLCPHLKCRLIFNEIEKTWDCPCHGSRFDIDGKCIEGPSNYDISYKKKF